jgi:methylated-DNA-[protein]-cysteine S-methyltransferase
MKSVFFYEFTVGIVGIAEDDSSSGSGSPRDSGAICRVFFCGERKPDNLVLTRPNGRAVSAVQSNRKPLFHEGFTSAETPLIKKAAAQLAEYFDGRRRVFDLPLALRGTDFQLSVWKALQGIPAGVTRSYKEVAALIGKPKAYRAVGMANNCNPIAIIIPCHRVIGEDGSLTGYAGGLHVKQYLLDLEKRPA